MEDAFDGRRVQQRVPKPARQRCASAPARRAPSARPQPVHPSPLAVKGRALQHNICGEATGFGAGPARAIPIPPRQSSPGACGPAARPKRRTEGSNITAADTLYHPALPRIRTHADDGAAGKRHLPGSRDELRALFRAYNLPVPRALPPPSHRTSAAGGHASSRPVSGLAAKGALQARPHPAAHPYHQRLRGLLDASSHAMHGAVPVPGRRVSLVNEQLRGPSAQQRASKQQAASRGAPVVAAVAVPKLGRHSDAGAEPLPMVLGRPLEVNQGYQAVLPGGGGQPGNRARQDKVLVSEHQSQPAEGAGDEHEQWDWVYRGPPTPESPYGSDILRAMLDVVSPRFEVRRPEGYIPITPSSIASSRYVRSDVWSWSCPGSPAVGFRPAPDGCADAGAAAAGGGGGGGASSLGRSPFAAARPNPARPMPRQSSPEPLHRKLLLRAAAAAAAAGGAPPLSRQSSALSAALQVAEAHDHGHGMTPPGGGDWNPSLRLRAEHQHSHLMPHLVAAGRASHDSRDPAHVEAPSRSTPESHEHSAQQQHLQQQQQQPVDYSSGPTPPPGKSRFYQQQQHHQPHEHALPQITPRQQVGTAAVLRRVSESGLPAATYDWQPSVSTLSNHNGAATPTRDLCTPRAALQLSHLPQRGSSAGRFSRAAAMASPVQGVQADGSRGGQLAFVMPSPAGPGLRPRGTPGRCVDLLWEPPPIQPSRALDRHRSGSRTPSPERTIRGESGPRMHNLAEAAAARLRQAAAVSGSRRTSSSPSPLPSVRRTGSHAGEAPSAEGGAARVAQPQQPYRSSSPNPVAVSARRVLYRPDGPSLSVGPAARSTSAYMRGRSAQEDTAAVSLLESQFAVRPRSSPAARAAAAALARAQHAMADSGGTSSAAATGLAPLRLGGMHGADTVGSDSAFPTLLLPSPLRHHGSSDMVNTHTRQAGTGGSAFSFHMSAAATGAADTSADSWPGAPTPALCKAPVSRQSSQGRRKWALPANSAPSSPRVQLFPVPDDDGSNTNGASKAASSPLCARGGDGARTPGSHRKRYVSLRRAGLARRNSVAAAAGSVACMQTAQSHTACSSPFTTPRELSSDAAAPGSGSDCGGAPSTGAMVGSSVDSWGTCLAAALPATGQPQTGGGTPLSTGADNVSPELQQKQPHLGDVTRTRAPMPSRFGPLSPAAALAQRSRYSSPAVRPGLRGSSPAAVSPFMGPGSVGDMTPPMSPLRQPQPSPLTAGVSAAADGVRRNLLSSFRSASACRPATSPVAGAPSASDVTPRCPAPRPASSRQQRASGLCSAPPQQMQRCPSAQQARRRQCDWPSPAQSQDLQSRPLAPLPPLAPSVPPTTRAASPSRQAKHGDTRCDQDVERRVAAGPPPAGRFAPQPPLAPRDSLAPRRPSTSGSIRSSKDSVGSARGASAALATSTDDDVAAGHVDARAVHTPNGPSAAPYPNQRLVQPAHPQRSILDSPDLGPKKARPSVDGTYLTPAGVSSRPASAASRCSSAGASDSSRSRHWSYRRARERAVFLNGVFAVAASSATVEE